MVWWLWVLLGIGLLALEMATPGGFFALFFGLSAILVGGLAGLGFAGPAWVQWVLFSALSIVALMTLRGPLQARLNLKRTQKPVDSLVGESVLILEDVAAGGHGKAELRGASWTARSSWNGSLSKGQRCKVERVEGLTLWVLPE